MIVALGFDSQELFDKMLETPLTYIIIGVVILALVLPSRRK